MTRYSLTIDLDDTHGDPITPESLAATVSTLLADELDCTVTAEHNNFVDLIDPASLGGSIAGPGGPDEPSSGVVIATERALLLDSLTVSAIDNETGEPAEPLIAMMLSGEINVRDGEREKANLLVITNADGAAAFVTEIVDLANRDLHLRDEADQPNGFGAWFALAMQERQENRDA